jgi:hypothetical protein
MHADSCFLYGVDDVAQDFQDAGQFPFLTPKPKWVGLGPLGGDKLGRTLVPGRTCAETTPMLSIGVIYIYENYF